MKRSFLLTALAVATLSVNVLAIQAEAGTTGLKPSANQGSQSSTNTTTNKEIPSDIQYDTNKYQYPAQQLIAVLQMNSPIIIVLLKTMFL